MLTFHGLPQTPIGADAALTIGVFDGVHRGHVALVARVLARARDAGYLAGVVTFDPHPLAVLSPHSTLRYLGDLDERLDRLERLGVDFVVVVPFTVELSHTSARDFVRPLVDQLRMRHLVIGHDFTLGHKRQGNEAFLRTLGQEWDYGVEAIEPVQTGALVASSSRIRRLLATGKIVAANEMLGYPYALKGTLDGSGRFDEVGKRQLPGKGHYQCVIINGGRRAPCAIEVRSDRLLIHRGGGAPGIVSVEFARDATAEAEGYVEIEHTADVALRVRAVTFPELLRQSALGMTALMTDQLQAGAVTEQQMNIPLNDDRETMLVDFLSRLLWAGETRHEIYSDFEITPSDRSMTIVAHGAPAPSVRKQVKAVTFHNLKIVERDGMLEATIVFDV